MARTKSEPPIPGYTNRTELDEIRAILAYFSRHELTFQGANSQYAASNTANGRQEHYNQLRTPFEHFLVPDGGTISGSRRINNGRDVIDNVYRPRLSAQVTKAQDDIRVVTANFPLIEEEDRRELLLRLGNGTQIQVRDDNHANRVLALFAGALLSELTTNVPDAGEIDPTKIGTEIWAAFTKVESYRFSTTWKQEILGDTSEIEKVATDLQNNLDTVESGIRSATTTLKGIEDQHSSMQLSAADMEARISSFSAKVTELETSTETRFVDFAKALEERLNLKQAGRLWREKAHLARLSWAASFVAILGLLVFLPWWAFEHRDTILAFVREFDPAPVGTGGDPIVRSYVSDALTVTSRLLLVTAPLGFLIWAIRFLIRYNMRSQLLMDDAGQRRAILETYFMLVERGIAEPTTDRAVLLEAIFRGLPGHGGDAPEPMSFAELLRLSPDGKKTPGN